MQYDFDTIISRENTHCDKYDHRVEIFGRKEVIPMWVADMDFPVMPQIIEAFKHRAEHPIFGYSFRDATYHQAIVDWVGRRGRWKIQSDWLDFSPGVVSGIVFALRAFTQEGDKVVIQPPVYHPFARQARMNDRVVVNNPLRLVEGHYEIDFEDLDQKLEGAKVFLMSNPHNPTGRVYTRAELQKIGDLCLKHHVLIFSDEIHADIIFEPNQHIHIASLSAELAQQTITFIAPSKTFNVAGLSTSVVITPNETVRRRLNHEFAKLHADQGNVFGAVALQTAYTVGDEWVDQLCSYVAANAAYVCSFLHEHLPLARCICPEGTFLLWLDFSAWPMTHEQTYRFFVEQAGVGMNEGMMFGKEGEGFMRMNIGAPRTTIERAMNQMLKAAIKAGIQ